MEKITTMNSSTEARKVTRQPHTILLKVAPLEPEHELESTAYSINITDEGIGVSVFHPLPVGSMVELIINNRVVAIGEVVYIEKNDTEWQDWGLDKMGIKLIAKNKYWPINGS